MEKRQIISIDYHFKDQDGVVLGGSEYSGPYSFALGIGDALPGLEKRLASYREGEDFSFLIPAEEAYGSYDEEKRVSLHESVFPQELALGERVNSTWQGQALDFTVIQKNGPQIILDGNHPLAGKDLLFEGRILYIGEEEHNPSQKDLCGKSICDCSRES